MGTRINFRKKLNQIKKLKHKNLIIVLENPVNIKNVGTIVRNVNALGATKIYIIDKKKQLPRNFESLRNKRYLIKTSVGSIKYTYVKVFDSSKDCIEYLENKNYTIVSTSPHIQNKKNINIYELSAKKIEKLAVCFGNESIGLSNYIIEKSSFCINIPIYGIVESLNLAVSTGIVLYEISRQRKIFLS